MKVVTFDGQVDGDWVIGFDDLEQLGVDLLAKEPKVVEERVAAIEPGDLATLIYTSGTTGRPKGVRLSHDGWTFEGAALRGRRLPQRGRPGVPLAADGALLRQGAPHRPAGRGLRLRHRRPGAEDRREPGHRQADVHGRRAAHLREGVRPRRRHDGGGGRRQAQDLPLGREASGREYSRAVRAGKPVSPVAQGQVRRWPTSWSSPRSASASAAGSSSSSPVPPRCRRTSPSGSTAPASSSSRATASPRPRPARSSTGPTPTSWAPSASRCRAPRSRSPRTARSCSRARTSCGATTTSTAETASALLGRRLARHRRHRRDRRRGLPADHRPQEGPVQDVGRQVRRAVVRRGHVQGRLRRWPASDRPRQRPQLLLGPHHARPRRRRRLGRAARHGGQVVRRDRRLAGDARGSCSKRRRRAQRQAQPLGDDQEVRDPRPRPLGRVRRAHAQPQAQAQGRRGQLPRHPRTASTD